MGPYKQGAVEIGRHIREFFRSPFVELLPFAPRPQSVTLRFALAILFHLTIHLASAADAGVDLFLTNDRRLLGLMIPGIQFYRRNGCESLLKFSQLKHLSTAARSA